MRDETPCRLNIHVYILTHEECVFAHLSFLILNLIISGRGEYSSSRKLFKWWWGLNNWTHLRKILRGWQKSLQIWSWHYTGWWWKYKYRVYQKKWYTHEIWNEIYKVALIFFSLKGSIYFPIHTSCVVVLLFLTHLATFSHTFGYFSPKLGYLYTQNQWQNF